MKNETLKVYGVCKGGGYWILFLSFDLSCKSRSTRLVTTYCILLGIVKARSVNRKNTTLRPYLMGLEIQNS